MVGGCRYVGGRHGVYMLGIFFAISREFGI